MTAFPKTYHFAGLNTPVGIEASVRNLPVIGEIPREVEGAFFRAVPDPAHAPKHDDDNMLSGDGMIARFDRMVSTLIQGLEARDEQGRSVFIERTRPSEASGEE